METRQIPLFYRAGKTPKIVGKIKYDTQSEDLGGFVEFIRPGAFADTLRSGQKVHALWAHDASKPLANSDSGSLILKDTRDALQVEIYPDMSVSWASDAVAAVKRGDCSGLSFGFDRVQDQWNKKMNTREVLSCRLLEVSPVVWAAYRQNEVSTRKNKKEKIMDTNTNFVKDMQKKYLELRSQKNDATGAELERIEREMASAEQALDSVWVQERMPRPNPGSINITRDAADQRFENAGAFFRSIAAAGTPGQRYDPRLNSRAATGLQEGTPSDGGFLVPTEYSSQILETMWTGSEILSRINKLSLKSNTIRIPGVDETSRADGSRQGGVLGYWLAEAAEKQASKPQFRQIQLDLNKVVVLCYTTDELLDDAPALSKYITRAARSEIDFKIVDAIINGSGAGQPLGIINSGCMVSVAKEAGQAASSVVWENVSKMWARLHGASRADSVWVISQDCEPQLHSMSLAVGTGGVPVYMPAGGASASPYSTLFGRPVVPIEQCQSLGTTGDIMLCDFSKYVAADRGGIKSDMSIHVRFIYDESVFRFVYKFDGQPELAAPITPFNAGDDLSHFVKLDTRS